MHDIVDNVSLEGEQVASGVAKYLSIGLSKKIDLSVQAGEGIRYVLPQRLHYLEDTIFSFRVQRPGHHQTLVFKTNQHLIKKKTFLQVNPAEMIRIKLSAQELAGLSNLKVELEL